MANTALEELLLSVATRVSLIERALRNPEATWEIEIAGMRYPATAFFDDGGAEFVASFLMNDVAPRSAFLVLDGDIVRAIEWDEPWIEGMEHHFTWRIEITPSFV